MASLGSACGSCRRLLRSPSGSHRLPAAAAVGAGPWRLPRAGATQASSPHPKISVSSKRPKTKTTKKCSQRATSNVFAMFDQSQIQEFKEAFNMIDQNRDGFIDEDDLHNMLISVGKNPTDEYLDAMMNEAPGPVNFTIFLTMFGEKLKGADPEGITRNTFARFDEEADRFIQEDLPERAADDYGRQVYR
ncbi:myosin regulatory light chain 2, smooth muscle minor isoform-like [Struthio camelus]|uniref:myosin regulatory light chain 2, smooth muscle minor isoform-like n=1 Tax=Struthio camelus TaxID=8801 RepID=UPI003603EBEB